jgi:hypothetical protein
VDYLLRRLVRTGFRRGLAGGHWAWLALALAAFVLRRARRPYDDAVSLPIRRGERYVVSLSDPGAPAVRPGDVPGS